jgi:hypothetical protein
MRIMGVCLHYTAGSEGPTSAEGGAAYDKRRADGTSCHLFTDSLGPALREVPDGDRAHTARAHGNEIFVHVEVCGTIQTRAQWLDPVSLATLRTTAAVVAAEVLAHGLQVRRMTDAEVRAAYFDNGNPNAVRGICEHANCTRAFPEDQGDHLDVGAGFPWDVLLDMVHQEIDGGSDVPKTFIVNQPIGAIPAGALYASGGSGFFHIHDPDDAVFYGQTWGFDAFAVGAPMTLEDAHRRFGPFLGEYNQLTVEAGPAGPPGPATLVPHNHKFMFDGTTGAAVATPAQA